MVHCCDRWLPTADPKYLRQPLYAFSMHGQLGVMIFFVISGYCIVAAAYSALLRNKSTWRYSLDRIRRIYPPYLAALALTALSIWLISFANNHHFIPPVNHLTPLPLSLRYWIANLFILQYELKTPIINVAFWSLGYEIAFYCLIGFFLILAKQISQNTNPQNGVILLVWCLGISTMGSLIRMIFFGNSMFPFDSWHQFSIGGLLFFLLEIKPDTAPEYNTKLRVTILGNVIAIAILTILFACLRQVGDVDAGHPSSRIRSLVCLAFAACLIPLRRIDSKISENLILKPFIWVGVFSYSLYLTHPIIIPYVDIFCRKIGLNGNLYWVAFWVQLIAAIVFARLFFRIIEHRFISQKQMQRIASEHVPSLV